MLFCGIWIWSLLCLFSCKIKSELLEGGVAEDFFFPWFHFQGPGFYLFLGGVVLKKYSTYFVRFIGSLILPLLCIANFPVLLNLETLPNSFPAIQGIVLEGSFGLLMLRVHWPQSASAPQAPSLTPYSHQLWEDAESYCHFISMLVFLDISDAPCFPSAFSCWCWYHQVLYVQSLFPTCSVHSLRFMEITYHLIFLSILSICFLLYSSYCTVIRKQLFVQLSN